MLFKVFGDILTINTLIHSIHVFWMILLTSIWIMNPWIPIVLLEHSTGNPAPLSSYHLPLKLELFGCDTLPVAYNFGLGSLYPFQN